MIPELLFLTVQRSATVKLKFSLCTVSFAPKYLQLCVTAAKLKKKFFFSFFVCEFHLLHHTELGNDLFTARNYYSNNNSFMGI